MECNTLLINYINYTCAFPGMTCKITKVYSVMGVENGWGQGCLFDYELFTEMDAVELSDSMRKYFW